MPLSCPLCSLPLSPSSLWAHLRLELKLPLAECRLCPQSFCSEADALEHFRGEASAHFGQEPRLIQPPLDPAQRRRLGELVRLARAGEEAVQKRLCICGQCQLFCREEESVTREAVVTVEQPSNSPKQMLNMPRFYQTDLAMENMLESKLAGPFTNSVFCQEDIQAKEERIVDEEVVVDEEEIVDKEEMPEADIDDELDSEASEEGGAGSMDSEKTSSSCSSPVPNSGSMNDAVSLPTADLRPRMTSDGKVACLQCGKRCDKYNFACHVRANHIAGHPFRCLLCTFSTRRKVTLTSHQMKEHDRKLSPKTYTVTEDKGKVQEWLALCFGNVKGIGYPESVCRACDKAVRTKDLMRHTATEHLKKPLHECRMCGYQSADYDTGTMNRHVTRSHKQRPGPATVDSSGLKRHNHAIKAMIPQFFTV